MSLRRAQLPQMDELRREETLCFSPKFIYRYLFNAFPFMECSTVFGRYKSRIFLHIKTARSIILYGV